MKKTLRNRIAALATMNLPALREEHRKVFGKEPVSAHRQFLFLLLSFAQFEREMIAERTRDKMPAARRRGHWVGGIPMLGYDISERGGALVVLTWLLKDQRFATTIPSMTDMEQLEENIRAIAERFEPCDEKTRSCCPRATKRSGRCIAAWVAAARCGARTECEWRSG